MDNKEIFTSVVRVKGSERYKVIPSKKQCRSRKKQMDTIIKGY